MYNHKVKENKSQEKDINEFELEEEPDYKKEKIVIYDIDKIDKIYKDIIEATEKIQVLLKQPSISGSALEVENKGFSVYTIKNNMKYNKKKKTLKTNNEEKYVGKIIEETDKKDKEEKVFISLDTGKYTWPTGETYQGSFNKNNYFHGNGNLSKSTKEESYTFESIFFNGYPLKEGIFKLSKKNLYDLYIQSDIIKNENENNHFKLLLSGKTTITKSQGGKEVYRFDGKITYGKIIGFAKIRRQYKVLRDVDIDLNYTKNQMISDLQNLEMEIRDYKPGNTFYYKANYIGGLKVGKFTLWDTKEKIDVKNKESELEKIIIRFKKILFRRIGKKSFEKLYRYNLSMVKLFNRIYKTKIDDSNQLIHIIGKPIKEQGLIYISAFELTNLKDLALNNSGINDMSPLINAKFPLLESLSLGKNNITSIEPINKFQFPNLKYILLGYNKIEDISPLKEYISKKIIAFTLIDNSISNITPLEKMVAPNLEQISLGSKITDISPLTKCNFPKLKQLGLKGNKIKNISSLINVNFPQLEVLYLNNNQIFDINPLKSAKFPNLLKLGLDNNRIKNIYPLLYLKSQKLNFINISHNKFRGTSSDYKDTIEYLKKKVEDIKY